MVNVIRIACLDISSSKQRATSALGHTVFAQPMIAGTCVMRVCPHRHCYITIISPLLNKSLFQSFQSTANSSANSSTWLLFRTVFWCCQLPWSWGLPASLNWVRIFEWIELLVCSLRIYRTMWWPEGDTFFSPSPPEPSCYCNEMAG